MNSTYKAFWGIMEEAGVDNSMGDYNDLAYSFIHKQGLEEQFEEYLCDAFSEELFLRAKAHRSEAFADGVPFKPKRFKWPKLQEHYDNGVKKAEEDFQRWKQEKENGQD